MSGFELDVSLEKTQELDKRLKQLTEDLQTKATRAGLRAAGKPIVAKAKAFAPFDDEHTDDHLRDSINISLLGKGRVKKLSLFTSATSKLSLDNPGQVMVIGPNKKVKGQHQGWKGALMEFGTQAGRRIGKRGRMKGVRYESRGVRPQPFLAPALARESAGINARFYQGLERYLNRVQNQ